MNKRAETPVQILNPLPDFKPPPSPQSAAALLRLARQLDFFPLALHMAAAHLREGKTPQDLLKALTAEGEDSVGFDRTFQTPSRWGLGAGGWASLPD